MTNLVEIDRWEDGVYQLETSDPVVGGPEGIDNLQAKQLANRTRYLKKAVEARQSDFDAHVAAVDPHPQYATHADLAEKVAALVAQSPEALDTLSELAKALGNDPNFATTITNQLALKAAIDSPVLTGAPKAPTPDQFDATKRIATMESLRRELGGMAGVDQRCIQMSADVALPASCFGKILPVQGNTPRTITLPSTTGVPDGAAIAFYNLNPTSGGTAHTVTGQAGQNIIVSTAFAQTMPLQPGDIVTLAVYAGSWTMSSGVSNLSLSRMAAFDATLDVSGSQRLPSGLIEKWGTATTDANGEITIVFPKRFPNAAFSAVANHSGGGAAMVILLNGSLTQDGVRFKVFNDSGMMQPGWIIYWRVLGK